jgi:hypothetical protein
MNCLRNLKAIFATILMAMFLLIPKAAYSEGGMLVSSQKLDEDYNLTLSKNIYAYEELDLFAYSESLSSELSLNYSKDLVEISSFKDIYENLSYLAKSMSSAAFAAESKSKFLANSYISVRTGKTFGLSYLYIF